ncbi:MAG TPA: hypothetical protein VF331_21865 [Polyangiales bacterium]
MRERTSTLWLVPLLLACTVCQACSRAKPGNSLGQGAGGAPGGAQGFAGQPAAGTPGLATGGDGA